MHRMQHPPDAAASCCRDGSNEGIRTTPYDPRLPATRRTSLPRTAGARLIAAASSKGGTLCPFVASGPVASSRSLVTGANSTPALFKPQLIHESHQPGRHGAEQRSSTEDADPRFPWRNVYVR